MAVNYQPAGPVALAPIKQGHIALLVNGVAQQEGHVIMFGTPFGIGPVVQCDVMVVSIYRTNSLTAPLIYRISSSRLAARKKKPAIH